MRRHLLIIFFLILCSGLYAQDKSNKGKEFWLGYAHNALFTQDNPPNAQTLVLYLSAEQAATVTVSVNSTGWSQTVAIPANTVDFSITIPKTGPDDARITNEGLSARGIHIVSNVPIVVYAHQYGILSSGATMLMPVETYGYTYYSLSYTQVSNYPDSYSWFYVVASEDNTRILITPSDSTRGGWLPTQTYTVNLNKGEIYSVFGKAGPSFTSKDMTGSKVVSIAGSDGNCHPVALFSGSSRLTVCNGNGGEFSQVQMFPANAWGTKYVTYHTINNTGGNITTPFLNFYRIAVRNPTTIVKRNGVVMTGLVRGFYYDFQSNSGDFIEADQPIVVAQFSVSSNECVGSDGNPLGDPEMIFLSPIEQGVKKCIFYNTRTQAINTNFINIIVPLAAVPSLRVDDIPITATEFITHPTNNNYAVVVRKLTGVGAQHSIICDSTFVATNYGIGFLESYGYNVGTLVNNLNAITEIKNVNSSTVSDTLTCPKTPVRFTLKIAYQATQIHWKLNQAVGITPNTDSIISNPVAIRTEIVNGRTYYVYTLQQDFVFSGVGSYAIPVTYTSPDIDACNNTETTNIKVTVVPGPKADFTFPSPFCSADSVHFTGVPNPNGFSLINYVWSFGDATNINGINAVKLFATGGPHDVRYRVYSASGCVGDTTKTITLTESPVVSLGNDISTCGSGPIVLDATNSNSTYLWQDGSTSPTFSVTTSGLYWVQVTKTAGGCSKRDSINITLGSFPGFNLGADRPICQGDTVTLNATVAGALSYLWNTGAVTPTIKVFAAGTYWCEVNNGCVQRDSIVITAVNPKPIVNFGADISTCTAPPILLDATNANSTYLWQDNSTNPTFNATASGLYWAQVTNSNGCVKKDSINIAFNSTPVFNLGADRAICEADTLTLNATVAGAISYLWNTGATTPTIKVFQAGTYWCEVNNGCTFRDDITITAVNPKPVVNLGNDISVCGNNPITLDATNPNSTYLWQDATTNPTLTATVSGLYWVQVTNNSGCIKGDSINIDFKPYPVFNLGADRDICLGDTLTLNATVANATSYQWRNGATTPAIKAFAAGTYWCDVTRQGCVFRDSLIITSVKPNPVVNLGSDVTVCEGITVSLNATFPNATYLWQDASTNPVFNVTTPGTYFVLADLNGCKKSDTTIVSYNLKPRFNLGSDQVVCPGSPLVLKPVLNPAWQLSWQDGSTGSTFTVTDPGVYSLTATNNCGPTTDDFIVVKGVCKVFMPTGFTPNNDGKNDLFKALGTETVTKFDLKIYNRLGQIVFKTTDKAKGWDGKIGGLEQSSAVFIYLVKYTDLNSTQPQLLKGTFVLMR